MTLQQSLNDFSDYPLPLSVDKEFLQFNRLNDKKTSLTIPSIVCYVKIKQNLNYKPFVETVVKCFISKNPSEDIKKDFEMFETFDEIFLHLSNEHLSNQELIHRENIKFENEVKRIKEYFEIQ